MTSAFSIKPVKCPECGHEFATKKEKVTQCGACGKEFKI